jgi:hypothetical protein
MTTPRIVSVPEYAMSSFTRYARTLLVLSAILVLPSMAGSAQAQVIDAWLNGTPVEPFAGNASARLKAMGRILVAIPDDQSRLDPYSYSRNPAGLRESRDSSYVEVPVTYQGHDHTDYGYANSAVLHGAGLHAEFRPGRKWAMAAGFDYANVDASRHDGVPRPTTAASSATSIFPSLRSWPRSRPTGRSAPVSSRRRSRWSTRGSSSRG